MNILFINHGFSKHCGVYTQGVRHFDSLKDSKKYNFIYGEVTNYEDLENLYKKNNPSIIMYNYMPVVMPWLDQKIKKFNTKNICIIHNITQQIVDLNLYNYNNIFDLYITLDMSLNLKNKNIFKTHRPVYKFINEKHNLNNPVKIGTFGFPFLHKGFHNVVKQVNQEFNEAVINLHMTDSYFCQNETDVILNLCKNEITKPNIKLNYSNNYLSEIELVSFLNKNDINILLYDNIENVGVSAAIDYLISAQKPILISKSQQFRNFFKTLPIYPEKNLSYIIENYNYEQDNVCNIYNDCKSILEQTEKIIDEYL
jgi:hypothetical protein